MGFFIDNTAYSTLKRALADVSSKKPKLDVQEQFEMSFADGGEKETSRNIEWKKRFGEQERPVSVCMSFVNFFGSVSSAHAFENDRHDELPLLGKVPQVSFTAVGGHVKGSGVVVAQYVCGENQASEFLKDCGSLMKRVFGALGDDKFIERKSIKASELVIKPADNRDVFAISVREIEAGDSKSDREVKRVLSSSLSTMLGLSGVRGGSFGDDIMVNEAAFDDFVQCETAVARER